MDRSSHTLACLFSQLGLNNSEQQIAQFIEQHKGIADDIALYEAEFWNQAQASFLQEALAEDSDWAEVVDGLSARLR
ncbi:DUF2789 domain-containing protein [Thalassotalea sp. LPB0316]|uniref:DUF2789 domain-containing protein n=1 Tax=Thalassotalea sp. LPB0316 TaxID=2769490 RepID=UPI001865AA63|nr:DUF2789 domain-containing protein [Thalassotalea sp. LPB0316]QOL24542.1 DUF2789 domain-containing protein [Thalassotalea sp. LPB0316]